MRLRVMLLQMRHEKGDNVLPEVCIMGRPVVRPTRLDAAGELTHFWNRRE